MITSKDPSNDLKQRSLAMISSENPWQWFLAMISSTTYKEAGSRAPAGPQSMAVQIEQRSLAMISGKQLKHKTPTNDLWQ
jgi:hypothetical protein